MPLKIFDTEIISYLNIIIGHSDYFLKWKNITYHTCNEAKTGTDLEQTWEIECMKWKVSLLVVASMLFGGLASYASLYGTFEGYPIVRVQVNGQTLTTGDVPALNLNGRTMVPIAMLRDLGIDVQWDASTETVNLSFSNIIYQPSSSDSYQEPVYQEQLPLPVVYDNPKLYSNDGKTFLGELTTNTYDTDSVFNEYGDYGSEYSQTSIWNQYGDYGDKYSDTSAFNEYADEPPIIVYDNEIIGYLTTNTHFDNGLSPQLLYDWLVENDF